MHTSHSLSRAAPRASCAGQWQGCRRGGVRRRVAPVHAAVQASTSALASSHADPCRTKVYRAVYRELRWDEKGGPGFQAGVCAPFVRPTRKGVRRTPGRRSGTGADGLLQRVSCRPSHHSHLCRCGAAAPGPSSPSRGTSASSSRARTATLFVFSAEMDRILMPSRETS